MEQLKQGEYASQQKRADQPVQAASCEDRSSCRSFEHLRSHFLDLHGARICYEIGRQSPCYAAKSSEELAVVVEPAPIVPEVEQRFLRMHQSHPCSEIIPSYHGTDRR